MSKTKKNSKNNNKTKISRYLIENYKSRISRDIFVYTQNENRYEFLVKPWSNAQHRAKGLYGNAFGTFLCRPPKDKKDLEQQIKKPINAKIMYIPQKNKNILLYDLKKEILGFKTEHLKSVLEEKFSDLEKANVECYKIPSSKNNKNSMLSAGMTILASFIEIEKKDYENLHWLDAKTAHNPKINIHAGIISHFMQDIGEKTNEKILKDFPKLKYLNNQKTLKGYNIKKIYNLVNKY